MTYFGKLAVHRRCSFGALVLSNYEACPPTGQHSHPNWFISVCLEGSYVEEHRNGAEELREGDMIAHPPNEVHANHWTSRSPTIFALELAPAASALFAPEAKRARRQRGSCANAPLGRLAELASGKSDFGLLDLLCTAEILMPLIGTDRPESSRTSDRLMLAASAVEQHPEITWTLADLASIAGYQRTYFVEAFGRAYGCSPGGYIRRLRLRYALRMMADGSGNLTDIAHASGFYDSSHMNRTFRELLGTPPTRLS